MRVATFTLAVLALLLVAAASAPARPASRSCLPSDARRIASSTSVLVFRRHGRIVACTRGTGKRHALGDAPNTDSCFPDYCAVTHVHVAGRLVAYSVEDAGRAGFAYQVVLLDGVTGRKLVRTSSGSLPQENKAYCWSFGAAYLGGVGPVTDLVLTADGALAWIAERECEPPGRPTIHEVHAFQGSIDTLLDASATVAPTPLTISGRTIHWTDGGTPRSADIVPAKWPRPPARSS